MNDYRCPICGSNHLESGSIVEIGGLKSEDVILCENESYIHIIRRGREIIARALKMDSLRINKNELILN